MNRENDKVDSRRAFQVHGLSRGLFEQSSFTEKETNELKTH